MPAKRRFALRRCGSCRAWFRPRVKRQIYCRSRRCSLNRRRNYMKRYMARWKASHPEYWKTSRQYDYLRRWRETHPRYFRQWRRHRDT